MRVLVIGGPGTGKTTAARAIATERDVPVVELDRAIAYRPPASDPGAPFSRWERVAWDDCVASADELAARPAWVAEGVYAGWTGPLADAADAIIWLDLPGRWAATGVARRQFGRMWSGDPDRYDGRGALRLLRRAAIGYRRGPVATEAELRARDGANSAATTEAFLAPRTSRVTRCRTRRDVRDAVAAVRNP